MWRRYNEIEKYCKCYGAKKAKYSIAVPTLITTVSNRDTSGGGCGASDASYGSVGTNLYGKVFNTSNNGANWYFSTTSNVDIESVKGLYMTRNGKYSIFGDGSDLQLWFSDDYGESYNSIGSPVSDGETVNYYNCYLNEAGTLYIVTTDNGFYVGEISEDENVAYITSIGAVYNVAANADFSRIWVPSTNGTYVFKYTNGNATIIDALMDSTNWKKSTNSTLQTLNGYAAASSLSGETLVIGAAQITNGVYLSFNYGEYFTNIVSLLDYSSVFGNAQCGDICLSSDGKKMIVSVYQDANYPLYICTLTKGELTSVIKYSINAPVDAISCGNDLVIYNTYDSTTNSGSFYYTTYIDISTPPPPPEPVQPLNQNTSYNIIQQSCKMAYAQTIRAQFNPTESINITGGNTFNNTAYLNSQACRRLLNNFTGMPTPPVLSGKSIFYPSETPYFSIKTQTNILAKNIQVYYYNNSINSLINITGTNGDFVARFKNTLSNAYVNIYATCTNKAGRQSLPSNSYSFTVTPYPSLLPPGGFYPTEGPVQSAVPSGFYPTEGPVQSAVPSGTYPTEYDSTAVPSGTYPTENEYEPTDVPSGTYPTEYESTAVPSGTYPTEFSNDDDVAPDGVYPTEYDGITEN
jgi:hypothetical protein